MAAAGVGFRGEKTGGAALMLLFPPRLDEIPLLDNMKKNLTFLFLLAFQTFTMAQTNQPELIYFGDPMCSWCYGFSPEFSQVAEAMEGRAEVRFVMGGLRPYGTETMADLSDFLQHHWEEVGQRSGQKFTYGILKKTDFTYDTEPACRAVVTMRHLKPEVEFDYFKAVQSAFYFENKNTNDAQTFAEVASIYGVDEKTFLEKFESDEMKNAVREDFLFSQNMGVRGFPTVVLKYGGRNFLISNGYAEAESVLKEISKVMDN
jgi:putative protein-disulfide isomerase